MIHFTRTTSVAPGKMAEALAFAGEINDYLGSVHGQKMQLMLPVGGNPHRLCWSTSYENMAALDQFQARTWADPKYGAILAKGAGVFVAGAAHDDIWRSV